MHVREATEGDVEQIVEFNRRLADETEDHPVDVDVLRGGVRRGLARPQYCRYFIAEDHGQPIGMTMVTYEWTDWRDGVLWWIQSVYVNEDRRGQGVFRALYDHIETAARSVDDVRGLRLYVRRDNERARQAYVQLGMHHTAYLVYETDWSGALPKHDQGRPRGI